jgi:DNA polymerase III subunit delta
LPRARSGAIARPARSGDPLLPFLRPDESQSRAHGERLLKALEADKVRHSAQSAKADPALLADEASAIGLFGGKRAIWVEPAGDEIAAAAEALLQAPAAESPVIAIAGALRKTSALVKLAEGHELALAHISYQPDQRDAVRLVEETCAGRGPAPGSRRCRPNRRRGGNDRAIIAQELAKFALYCWRDTGKPLRGRSRRARGNRRRQRR